jgi:hypothetical protein
VVWLSYRISRTVSAVLIFEPWIVSFAAVAVAVYPRALGRTKCIVVSIVLRIEGTRINVATDEITVIIVERIMRTRVKHSAIWEK